MVKKDNAKFQGIPNEALAKVILRTMYDAATLLEAGIPLPEFKQVKEEGSEPSSPLGFSISNAAFGEYMRVSAEITQMAADLRKSQGPKLDF